MKKLKRFIRALFMDFSSMGGSKRNSSAVKIRRLNCFDEIESAYINKNMAASSYNQF